MYIAQSSSRYFSLILHTTHHGITTRLYHRSGQFLLNNNNENYSVIGEQSLVSGGSWTPLTEKLSSGIFTLYRRGQNKSTESQTFIRQVLLTEKNQVFYPVSVSSSSISVLSWQPVTASISLWVTEQQGRSQGGAMGAIAPPIARKSTFAPPI